MSEVLDIILAQSDDQYPATVALSPNDVTVLLFALSFLEQERNWYTGENPIDEITTAQWDTIEKLVASAYQTIMNPLIGMIFPIVNADIPENCLLCDGATYLREDYPNLYAAMDGVFHVDADNFSVPDLRSRVIVGSGAGAGLSAYSPGDSGGVEAVTLSTAQMPTHQHGLFQGTAVAIAPGELPVVIPFAAETGSTGLAGSGGSHENRQPFTALKYVIVAQ